MANLGDLTSVELLKLHGQIINELMQRKIAKTRNQPIAEYSKWLVRNKLNLHDVGNPNEKYDGYDDHDKKYLVRSRQIIDDRAIRFSVIRNLKNRNFDFLVAVSFDNDIKVTEAYIIPIVVLLEQFEYNEYQNGYLLKLNQFNLNDKRIQNIKQQLNN